MTYEHQFEIATIGTDGNGAMATLCEMLNRKSAEGFECITVLLVPMSKPTMSGGILQATRPEPAFAVLLRRPKEAEDGQTLLDRG